MLWDPLAVIQVLARGWWAFNALQWVNRDLGYSKSLLTFCRNYSGGKYLLPRSELVWERSNMCCISCRVSCHRFDWNIGGYYQTELHQLLLGSVTSQIPSFHTFPAECSSFSFVCWIFLRSWVVSVVVIFAFVVGFFFLPLEVQVPKIERGGKCLPALEFFISGGRVMQLPGKFRSWHSKVLIQTSAPCRQSSALMI